MSQFMIFFLSLKQINSKSEQFCLEYTDESYLTRYSRFQDEPQASPGIRLFVKYRCPDYVLNYNYTYIYVTINICLNK